MRLGENNQCTHYKRLHNYTTAQVVLWCLNILAHIKIDEVKQIHANILRAVKDNSVHSPLKQRAENPNTSDKGKVWCKQWGRARWREIELKIMTGSQCSCLIYDVMERMAVLPVRRWQRWTVQVWVILYIYLVSPPTAFC